MKKATVSTLVILTLALPLSAKPNRSDNQTVLARIVRFVRQHLPVIVLDDPPGAPADPNLPKP